jgi:ATP-binding cassette subfamily F protein 3
MFLTQFVPSTCDGCNTQSHNYGNKVLFEDANLLVEAGERIAIVGPNGCGKSTFLRLLLNNEKPNSGILELGEHNIVPIYFAQNQVNRPPIPL